MIPKFRFYYLKLNKIYEVVSIDCLNEQVDCILPEMNGDIFNWDWNVGVLMQSTGLFDKNGKEIFEGDILKVEYGDLLGETRETLIIAKNPFEYSMEEAKFLDFSYIVEIIGNKFEHPHFIKE